MNESVSQLTEANASVETNIRAEIKSRPLPKQGPTENLSQVPAEIRSILSPPPLLATEDPNGYYALLDGLAREVRPCGIIEWLWLKDIADLTWRSFATGASRPPMSMANSRRRLRAIRSPVNSDHKEPAHVLHRQA